jgi:hypothetical protein
MAVHILRSLSDEEFLAMAAKARSCRELFRLIGAASVNSRDYAALRRRADALDVAADYLLPGGGTLRSCSDDEIRVAVAASRSYAEVLRRLGYVAKGGNYSGLHRRIAVLRVDTSHMKGQTWRRGLTGEPGGARALEQCLVSGRSSGGATLRRRLVAEGLLAERCAICEGEEWLSSPMPLELDHINGDHLDNRLSNLRLLCCNCHALTPTYRGRNISRRKRGSQVVHSKPEAVGDAGMLFE